MLNGACCHGAGTNAATSVLSLRRRCEAGGVARIFVMLHFFESYTKLSCAGSGAQLYVRTELGQN